MHFFVIAMYKCPFENMDYDRWTDDTSKSEPERVGISNTVTSLTTFCLKLLPLWASFDLNDFISNLRIE